MRTPHEMLEIEREPLSLYGSLESAIRELRDHRPLDLNAEVWRRYNPDAEFTEWRVRVRNLLLQEFHYDPGKLDLRPEVHSREEREGYILERISFNTTPWFRVNGYFLLPTDVPLPVPGLVVFHAWGGPMLFGKERIVNTGQDHPVLVEHRKTYYSGNYLTEEFVKRGYAVVVIDAYHFGERAPRGIGNVPADIDPFTASPEVYKQAEKSVREQLYYGVRQLNWAGTTWMGVNFWDDSRCVDYLVSRPEVDSGRIGCTGLSGGGWRTNMLAALDDRIKAAVSGCWMTTGDYQQVYNVNGAIGTFCLLPGVWNRIDVPDLTIMSAPCASMVISGSEDRLFSQEGQQEAARQIQAGYEWAGCPERFNHNNPAKAHCYDAELQQDALRWFDQHLK